MEDHNIVVNYEELQDAIEQVQHLSTERFGDLPLFDGILDYNNPNHVRTGIIQDPAYEQYYNRTDANGAPLIQRYSHLTEETDRYPFNGVNAVDPLGMMVSVVWLDGQDGGFYNSVQADSTPKDKVQRLILTFPQCWSDLDRSCGDFSLPVVGTICRIGMVRNNVGIYLGAVPLDRAKLPQLRLGDYLKRHYSQNTHYITDQSTKNAYLTVLDKDIHDSKPYCETRGTEEYPKPYETDVNKLSNLHKYQAHRLVQASDGISISVKQINDQHKIINNERTFDWSTNISLSAALSDLKDAVGESTLNNLTIKNFDGYFQSVQDNVDKYSIVLNTSKDLQYILNELNTSLGLNDVKNLQVFNHKTNLTALFDSDLTLANVLTRLGPILTIDLKNLQLSNKDGTLNYSKDGGLIFNGNLTVTVAKIVLASLLTSSYMIMGSDGYEFKTPYSTVSMINGVYSITATTINVVVPAISITTTAMNIAGTVNVIGSLNLNGHPVATV